MIPMSAMTTLPPPDVTGAASSPHRPPSGAPRAVAERRTFRPAQPTVPERILPPGRAMRRPAGRPGRRHRSARFSQPMLMAAGVSVFLAGSLAAMVWAGS
jgi:hypothetical protein